MDDFDLAGACLPGDDEHPRRPSACSPFERIRPTLPDQPFTRWRLRDLPDLLRFALSRTYRPR